MKTLLSATLLLALSTLSATAASPFYDDATQRIANEVQTRGQAFSNLQSFVAIGPRLCGSPQAAQAVEWAKAKLESFGLDRVWLQPVQVPVWVRGDHEAASVTSLPTPFPLRITALGNSAGTPSGGVEATVVEVKGLDDVKKLGAKVKGKIVFYNRPMDASLPDSFEAYRDAVDQRSGGPSLASRFGAVAVLVRTMTTLPDDPHPHTGATRFTGTTPIPAAAISTHDANALSKLLAGGTPVRVRLELSAHREAATQSFNVIGELKGSSLPDEIIDVGGHLDSWDLAPAAHDDGAGVVQSLEVIRVIKALGLQPKRTIRAVLFMCEEVGGIGGIEYARQAKTRGERHILATESDRGGFQPRGFAVEDASAATLAKIRSWSRYLAPLGAGTIDEGDSGTDVGPLMEQGTVTLDLVNDSKHYFDFHHSETDQLSAVNPKELQTGAAALAVLTFLAAQEGL